MFRNFCRPWRDESGTAAIEFAFISLALLIGTLGTVEAGRALLTYYRLASAMGATTRLVQMQASDNMLTDSISSRFSPVEQAALTIQVDQNVNIDGVIYTRVNAQYALPLLMPGLNLFLGNVLTLRAIQLVPTS
jgi:Flp pilus assembly protein TadG